VAKDTALFKAIHPRRTVTVPERSLRAVIDYLWDQEKKHYEELGKPKDHIFEHLSKLELST